MINVHNRLKYFLLLEIWISGPAQPSPSDTVTWRSQRALLTFTFHMSLNTILERHLVIASLLKRLT